jgi:predicted acylesterase/phospholipase RssA
MLPADQKKDHCAERRPPFECTALLLQGGGALGAYQAGVYEALSEAGIHPDWVAGISIGAVNSAIIAGNLKSGWKDCADFGNVIHPVSLGVGRRIS